MKLLKNIIFWTWCFPQSFLGAIYYILNRKNITKKRNHKDVAVFFLDKANFGGVSLGKFIFVNKNVPERTINHEYGHTIQGFILGPLYLLLVGIPSFTLATISRKNKHVAMNYFNYYPENWADSLGHVKRK